MRTLLLFVLFAATAAAQTVPEPVLTDLGDNHFTLCSDKTASGGITNARVQRTDNATWTAEFTNCHENDAGDGCTDGFATLPDGRSTACVYVTDLIANTPYLVHMHFHNGTSWTSDSGVGYQTSIQDASVCANYPSNCEDVDQDGAGAGTNRALLITTTNVSAGVDTPTAPTHSISFSAAGSIDSEVVVAAPSGVCDAQSLITSQAAAYNADGGAVTYAVRFPNALDCKPGTADYFTIPDLTNKNGEFLLYSDEADTDANPPDGGLIALDTTVGGFVQNTDYSLAVPLVQVLGSGHQPLRLKRMKIQRPDPTTVNYEDLTLTGWTDIANPVITLSSAYDEDRFGTSSAGSLNPTVYFSSADIHAPTLRSGRRQTYDGASTDLWTRVSSTTLTPSWTLNPTEGLGSTSAGVMSRDITHQFTSATAASQPVLTFADNLNFADGFEYTLTSVVSGVATNNIAYHMYGLQGGARAHLLIAGATGTSGSTDADCNTLHTVTASNMSSGTWTLSDSGLNCTGGTAKVVDRMWLHDLSGYTYEAMSCIGSVLTQTTIKLLLCTATTVDDAFTPDFTGLTVSGYLSFQPQMQPALLDIGDATGIIIESVFFDEGGPPYVATQSISGDGSIDRDMIVIGSRAVGGRQWQPVSPLLGIGNENNRNNNFNFYTFFGVGAPKDVQFINNALETEQSLMLSPNDANLSNPEHLTFSGLIYTQPANNTSGSTASGGIQAPARQQPIELKNGGKNILVEGLAVFGQKANVTTTTPAFLCQTTAGSSTLGVEIKCSDIDFKNNFIVGMMAVSVATTTVSTSNLTYTAHGPARITNNAFFARPQYDKPTGDQLNADGYLSTFSPTFARLAHVRDLTVEDNTMGWNLEPLRAGTQQDYKVFFDLQDLKTGSAQFTNNLYVDQDAATTNYNLFRITGTQTWAAIEGVFTADGAVSTVGTLSGNRVAACTQSPATYAWDSANNAHGDANTRMTAVGGNFKTYWPFTPLSADSQACNTRLDEVLESGSWDRKSGGEGADVDAILDAIGQIRNVTVGSITSGGATIGYEAPSSSSTCHVIYKAAPVSSFTAATGIGAVTPSTSLKTRSAVITGLSPYTTYDVQLQCDRGERVYVAFTTIL